MKIEITYKDEWFDVATEEDAYKIFLVYLKECVRTGDLTAFNFKLSK